ncbi:VanZ family protein [Virgibacillus oceani]
MYLVFFSIFYVYILFTLSYTQFPIYIQTPEGLRLSYSEIFQNNIIYIPQLSELISPAGLANIVMTIPFGFGSGFLIRVNLKRIILFGILFSFSLELLQFTNMVITQISQRTVNVNDLINNTIGAVIGYFLFVLFVKCFKSVIDKYNIQLNRMMQYINDLTNSKIN